MKHGKKTSQEFCFQIKYASAYLYFNVLHLELHNEIPSKYIIMPRTKQKC